MRDDCAGGHYIVNTYAPLFNALIVCVEVLRPPPSTTSPPQHRFYGDSQPFPTMSTENLKYLTSQQALADFAEVAVWLKRSHPDVAHLTSSPPHLFRQEISSPLVAPTRAPSLPGSGSSAPCHPPPPSHTVRYPGLVALSLAASAPVQAQLDFPEYDEVVAQSLVTMGSPNCTSTVAQAVRQFLAMSPAKLASLFGTCAPLDSTLNVATFWESFSDGLSGFVQYNNDNRQGYPFNVEELCRRLTSGPVEVPSPSSPPPPHLTLIRSPFPPFTPTGTTFKEPLVSTLTSTPMSLHSRMRSPLPPLFPHHLRTLSQRWLPPGPGFIRLATSLGTTRRDPLRPSPSRH